jgi:hypothetical protein
VSESIGSGFRLLVAAVLVACALGVGGALLLVATRSLVEGLIVAAITVLGFRAFWKVSRRQRELLKHGYFAGRRLGTHWRYEELRGGEIVALELPLEYAGRGEYDIHVPSERDWLARMPGWARERRAEIVQRLEAVFKRSQIHFDADVPPESE